MRASIVQLEQAILDSGLVIPLMTSGHNLRTSKALGSRAGAGLAGRVVLP